MNRHLPWIGTAAEGMVGPAVMMAVICKITRDKKVGAHSIGTASVPRQRRSHGQYASNLLQFLLTRARLLTVGGDPTQHLISRNNAVPSFGPPRVFCAVSIRGYVDGIGVISQHLHHVAVGDHLTIFIPRNATHQTKCTTSPTFSSRTTASYQLVYDRE